MGFPQTNGMLMSRQGSNEENSAPPGRRLSFTVHPGKGPYLLLVHGFLSSSAQWMLNLAALSKVCQPVTVDLWGHGKSPAPHELNCYTTAGYAEQFESIRTTLGAEQWFVCGYSIGASLTLNYAHNYSKRIIGHIFTNSTSAFTDLNQVDGWHDSIRTSTDKILAGGLAAIEKIPVHPKRAYTLPKPVYEALLADAEFLSPIGVANTYRGTMPDTNILSIAGDNARPALMCWGTKERRFAPLAEWAVAHMANLAVVKLNTGHGVNMEDSNGFNEAVIEFIRAQQTS